MAVTLTRIDLADDREQLLAFMTGNEFPFHVGRTRTRAEVEQAIDEGAYGGGDRDSYWIDHSEVGRIGVIRFEDLDDDTPLFDLRLAETFRGRGLGAEVVRAACDFVFGTMPDVDRFEGQTREDNYAMRRVLQRCGFVKEAHYREAWPVGGRRPYASVAYGLLRRDWESGETTPVVWDDFPE